MAKPKGCDKSKQGGKVRNIQQAKEHDKRPPNQSKEEETGSLPEK